MNTALTLLCVSIGAGLGAQLRYGLDLAFTRRSPTRAALATLSANIAGSLLIGAIVAVLNKDGLANLSPMWAQTLTAGIAGGLTTFSTVTAQVMERVATRPFVAAMLGAGHAGFGFAAAGAGWWVTWNFLIS